jgi:hypothetical protein
VREINGKRWLSSYEVATVADVSPSTVQRWAKRVHERKGRGALSKLVITKDPTNDRFLFEEKSVKKLVSRF